LRFNFKFRRRTELAPFFLAGAPQREEHAAGRTFPGREGTPEAAVVRNKEHATEAFEPVAYEGGLGERISFIAFAHGSYSTLKPEVVTQLKALGFPAARSDGKEFS
jgi:hypothetical protein